jgi:formamidopyrimidine-DNA glycosylase
VPELPEVEMIRRGLAEWLVGATVTDVAVLHPRAVRRHVPGPRDFADRLAGRRPLAVNRRGKYLWLPLDSGDVLVGHLGMSGQLLIRPADAPAETHLRIRFGLTLPAKAVNQGGSAATELRFVDQRTFGGLSVEAAQGGLPPTIAHIGPDPLQPDFDPERFRLALRRRHTGLKRALLDQSLVSGIGNIYADEALWRARLHFARPTETLRRPEVDRLLAGVREVMTAALAVGGTSFDALYVNVNGESGYFSRSLHAYGRAGQECDRCGTPIERVAFMNRSSYLCPRCQPRPRAPRW